MRQTTTNREPSSPFISRMFLLIFQSNLHIFSVFRPKKEFFPNFFVSLQLLSTHDGWDVL